MVTIAEVDKLRLEADHLIQTAKLIIRSAETTLAMRSLQMGKSWLGKVKGELGAVTPYSIANEAKRIPPTAEQSKIPINISDNQLQNVNQIREDINKLVIGVQLLQSCLPLDFGYLFPNQAIIHLSEARMWYGYELANIRKKALAEEKSTTSPPKS